MITCTCIKIIMTHSIACERKRNEIYKSQTYDFLTTPLNPIFMSSFELRVFFWYLIYWLRICSSNVQQFYLILYSAHGILLKQYISCKERNLTYMEEPNRRYLEVRHLLSSKNERTPPPFFFKIVNENKNKSKQQVFCKLFCSQFCFVYVLIQ